MLALEVNHHYPYKLLVPLINRVFRFWKGAAPGKIWF